LAVLTISFVSISNAKSLNDPKLIKFIDDKTQVEFLIPKNAKIRHPRKKHDLNTPLMQNSKIIARVKTAEMLAQVESFDIAIDFNPVDWLQSYATFSGYTPVYLKTVETPKNLVLGVIKYALSESSKVYETEYLAIAGKHGYLISGQGPWSDPLVNIIASSIILPGEKWGNLDKIKEVKFQDQILKFRDDYTFHDASKGKTTIMLVSSEQTVSESSTLIALKTGANKIHSENVRRFSKELSNLKFTSKLLRENKNESTFEMQSQSGDNFVGLITTTQSGASVSMIVPSMLTDPNAWLSGKYYYIRTLQALN
jgi:hypothetical protein